MGAGAAGKKTKTDRSLVLDTALPGRFLSQISPGFFPKPPNLLGIQTQHFCESPRDVVLAAKAILWGLGQRQETSKSPFPRKQNPKIIAVRIPAISPTKEKRFLTACHF